MFKKLQMKMTIYFTLVLIGILIASSTIMYFTLASYNSRQLSAEVDNMLNTVKETAWTEEANEEKNSEADDTTKNEIKLNNGKDIIIPGTISSFSYYFIFDNNANLVTSNSKNSKEYNEILKISLGISKNMPNLYRIENSRDMYFLVVKRPIVLNGVKVGSYCVAKDVSAAYETMDNLFKIMLITLIAGSALSLFLGFIISGKTIQPIKGAYLSKERFVADASHELRTPISIIQLSADVLKSEVNSHDDFLKQVISDIEGEAHRMTELVENLLLLARNDSGRLNVHRENFDLSNFLLKNIKPFNLLAEEKAIIIEENIQEGLIVYGDKKLLKSLIIILIDNAIKYSHVGGTVTVRATKTLGDKLLLEVEDHGIGMAKEKLNDIFERFYRLESSRSKEVMGFGLGLSIAKEIVTIHSGSITVFSEEGKGSIFKVIL